MFCSMSLHSLSGIESHCNEGIHYCELPSGALICKLRSVSEAPAEAILTLLLAFSGKRDVAWCGGSRVGWICGLGTLYLWIGLASYKHRLGSFLTYMTQWDDSFQQAGDGLTVVLYECRKWRFYSSATATRESEEGKDEKLLGIIQRTSYLWNYMAFSLCPSPIPFNILVLKSLCSGYNRDTTYHTLLFLYLF